tara:strand:+ start:328 stop:564 length:237 start_codon:yes stop_codon:yes gene_type:complete
MEAEYVVETHSGSLYKVWMVGKDMFFIRKGKTWKVDGFAEGGGFPPTIDHMLPGRTIQFNEKLGITSAIRKVYKKIRE